MYVLVIVVDYSWVTWVRFLRTKDVTPEVIIKLIKQLLVRLIKTDRIIRSNDRTEFIIKQLVQFYESIGITHL